MKLASVTPAEGKDRTYSVAVGNGALEYLPELLAKKKYTKIALVTEPTVRKLFAHELARVLGTGVSLEVFEVPSGESAKTVEVLQSLWRSYSDMRFDRSSLSLHLGGGALGDIAGFAAATFQRGIDYIQIPTTLLAQVDASIGGKLAINFGGAKNQVGVVRQPQAVVADTALLSSLSLRDFRSGVSEMIKHGIILSSHHFEALEEKALDSSDQEALERLVFESIELKASVVAADPEEADLRKVLNAGHTFGHAFESLAFDMNIPLLHGEAVSIGLIAEAKLACLRGLLPVECFERIEKCVERQGLPTRLSFEFDLDKLFDLLLRDKKNRNNQIRWVLPKKIGDTERDVICSREEIEAASRYVCK
ncbi:MAG: 3-dehydroquinate synthase [Bdellovibrionales bacterium]|nr:3-dehydroquinate synthase [Bdellovibrionales bacterium]